MSSDAADADARRRRTAELRAECDRLKDENDLFEIHLARIAPPGSERATETDAEDANAKRSKGSKKSKAKADVPVIREKLTDAERLDAVTAESELLERIREETEAANERGLMDLRAACDEVEICLQELKKAAHDFKKEVAVGAVNPRTGLVDPARWQRHSEQYVHAKESTVEKLTLTNKTLRNQITHAESTLRQKEEMGEVLHAVDFEKLKIENQQFAERIEERSAELGKQKDSLAVASLTVNKLKRQLDEASARMRQLQADMDQKRYYMGTFDANLDGRREGTRGGVQAEQKLAHRVQQRGTPGGDGVRAPEERDAAAGAEGCGLGTEAGGCADGNRAADQLGVATRRNSL